MIKKLRALFDVEDPSEAGPNPALAAAALMFEVAWADHDVHAAELAEIAGLLKDLFDLPEADVRALLDRTRGAHDESVGVYPFTRAINEELDQEQKFDIVCALWRIAAADSSVDRFEEHTIRRIADLLYVPHTRFIEAKLRATRSI
jgi:uncharacterized tellurite resistance protein B-like protein